MIASPQRPAGPVMTTTPADRAVSVLCSILFCLSMLAYGLAVIWLSGLTTEAEVGGALGGHAAIDVFLGHPVVSQALAVQPPEDVSDDPSQETHASIEAELTALVEQLGEADVALVDEPAGPGSSGGSGDGDGPDTIVLPPDKDRPRRWFFEIDGIASVKDYARILKQLEIELGAFAVGESGSSSFVFLTSLTAENPGRRSSTSSRDERFYTTWQSGTLAQLDRALFKRADVTNVAGPVIHFSSPALEARLAKAELTATRREGRRLSSVRRTVFSLTNGAASPEFYVKRQYFRD